MYEIEQGYTHRATVLHHDDRSFTDGWQKAVYAKAREIIDELGYASVLDIGCGSGYKLVQGFSDLNIVGLELEPALTFLKDTYPDGIWLLSDFSNPPIGEFDIIICSDVIEHIANPDELLDFMVAINGKRIVLSTPAREQYINKHIMGPPQNPCHYREWKTEELNSYLSTKFNIIEHYLNSNKGQHCQIVVMESK